MAEFAFKAIGTSWIINTDEEIPEIIKRAILDRVELFEENYSRFRESSIVSKMSREIGKYTLPDDAEEMFSVYRKLYEATNGMVTPLMGKVLSDAGYDSKYSLKPKDQVSVAPKWDEVINYKHPVLELKEPVSFDFGAAGKGYLVDLVSLILDE